MLRCVMCIYMKESNLVKADSYTRKITKKVSCQGSNIMYLIESDKDRCKWRYSGFTTKEFRERMCQIIGYVRNKVLTKAAGDHFNLPGHKKVT